MCSVFSKFTESTVFTGDVILGLEPVSESWWRGKNGPLKGIFPLTMVAELESNDGPRSRSASVCGSSSLLRMRSDSVASHSDTAGVIGASRVMEMTFARALVDVVPQLDGELAFQLGDLIEITEVLDDDWLYGKCHNKEGLVSSVCVELLVEDAEVNDGPGNNQFVSCSSSTPFVQEPTATKTVESLELRTGNIYSGSFTSENTRSHDAEVTAYGRVMFPFVAQIPTELSLTENSIVTLIQHVDADWTEGEVDGKRGMFPTSFIEIIVDCPYAYSQDLTEKQPSSELPLTSANSESLTADNCTHLQTAAASTNHIVPESGSVSWAANDTSIKAQSDVQNRHFAGYGANVEEIHEIGLVLYSFLAEVTGDISVNEGDTVEVIKTIDENWLKVQTEGGHVGQVPRNHIEIIGPWPKSKSDSEVVDIASSSSYEQKFKHTGSRASAPNIYEDTSKQISDLTPDQTNSIRALAFTRYPAPVRTPSLPSKLKPPLHPKPTLSPKPSIPVKPTSVASQQSFTRNKPGSFSISNTKKSVLESSRPNSLSSLDSLIAEEISKAKGDMTSKDSDIIPECSSPFHSNRVTENLDEYQPPNASHTFPTETNISGLDSLRRSSAQTVNTSVSSQSASTNIATRSEINTSELPYKSPENNTRRNVFASPLSCSEDNASNSSNRRKSTSFVEQKMFLRPEGPAESSSFVNKAFQMDTAEGVLINLHDKDTASFHRSPSRVAPPRPTSAVASSPSHTDQVVPVGKVKGPPPRPTGPRMASAPSKTPLVPVRVAPSPKLVPKRSAPMAPSIPKHNSPFVAVRNIPPKTQLSQHSPKPNTFVTAPKRPPPRSADLMSFSPDKPGTGKFHVHTVYYSLSYSPS